MTWAVLHTAASAGPPWSRLTSYSGAGRMPGSTTNVPSSPRKESPQDSAHSPRTSSTPSSPGLCKTITLEGGGGAGGGGGHSSAEGFGGVTESRTCTDRRSSARSRGPRREVYIADFRELVSPLTSKKSASADAWMKGEVEVFGAFGECSQSVVRFRTPSLFVKTRTGKNIALDAERRRQGRYGVGWGAEARP